MTPVFGRVGSVIISFPNEQDLERMNHIYRYYRDQFFMTRTQAMETAIEMLQLEGGNATIVSRRRLNFTGDADIEVGLAPMSPVRPQQRQRLNTYLNKFAQAA